MSLFRRSWLTDMVSRLDGFRGRTGRVRSDRKGCKPLERRSRRMLIDHLEERALLTVSPVDVGAGWSSLDGSNATAMDGDGEYVVVWTKHVTENNPITNVPGDTIDRLMMQLYKHDPANPGTLIPQLPTPLAPSPVEVDGTSVAINDLSYDDQRFGKVAMDGDGDFVVTWTDYHTLGGDPDIYARAFNANGTPRTDGPDVTGPAFRVNQQVSNRQQWSDVAIDAKGDFAITWSSFAQEDGGAGNGWGIYARRYDSTVHPLAAESLVNVTTAGDQRHSAIAMDAIGGYAIVWESGRSNTGVDVCARTFWPDGTAQGDPSNGQGSLFGEFVCNTILEGDQTHPDVAMESDGRAYTVTWTGVTVPLPSGTPPHPFQDPSGAGIYMKQFARKALVTDSFRFTFSGNIAAPGEPIRIYNPPDGDPTATPAQAWTDESSFIVPLDAISQPATGVSVPGTIANLTVSLNLQHPSTSFLSISLIYSPTTRIDAGVQTTGHQPKRDTRSNPAAWMIQNTDIPSDATVVQLVVNKPTGSPPPASTGFFNVVFDDQAVTPIASATPPYSGQYQPEQPLAALQGRNISGYYYIWIVDSRDFRNNTPGYLQSWSITVDKAEQNVGPDHLVNTTTDGQQVDPTAAMDHVGNFIIAWSGRGNQSLQADTSGIFYQQYRPDGTKVGSEIRANDAASVPGGYNTLSYNQTLPSVSCDAGGKFVISFYSFQSSLPAVTTNGIFACVANFDSTIGVTEGPQVNEVFQPDGTRLLDGAVLQSDLESLVFSFDQEMTRKSDGGVPPSPDWQSVTNVSNWSLTRDGSPWYGAIKLEAPDIISFGYGAAPNNLNSALNPIAGKFLARVYFENDALEPGTYVLTLSDVVVTGTAVSDAGGRRLDGDFDGKQTGVFNFNFTIVATQSVAAENRVTDKNAQYDTSLVPSLGLGVAREETTRSVAVDDSGDFAVVWTSYGQDNPAEPQGAGVYYRLYKPDGTPLIDEFQVNTTTAGAQMNPSVSIDADGDAVVVWESQGQDPDGSWGIYGRRFDATGKPMGGEFRVNTNTANDQRKPAVSSDAFGNFVVVWANKGQSYSYFNEIHGQLFNSDGNRTSGEFLVNSKNLPGTAIPPNGTEFGASEVNPSVAMRRQVGNNTDLAFVVSWDQPVQQTNGLTTDSIICARLFNRLGQAIPNLAPTQTNWSTHLIDQRDLVNNPTAEFQVDDDGVTDPTNPAIADVQHAPLVAPIGGGDVKRTARNSKVAIDSQGRFIVTWEAYRDKDFADTVTADSYGIYYRRFNADGTQDTTIDHQANLVITRPKNSTSLQTVWGNSANFAGVQVNASVAMDIDGDFSIVWNGNGAVPQAINPSNLPTTDQDPAGVWKRDFNPTDQQLEPESVSIQTRVNLTATGTQQFPSIAMTPSGDSVVVWAGNGIGDPHGVFFRLYPASSDTAGPIVSDVVTLNTSAGQTNRVREGEQVVDNVQNIIVDFDENMRTSHDPTNPQTSGAVDDVRSYQLMKDGLPLAGAITSVHLGQWVTTTVNAMDAALTTVTMTVADASTVPTSLPFDIIVDQEIMRVTGMSGPGNTVWNVVRNATGTTPATVHAAGASVWVYNVNNPLLNPLTNKYEACITFDGNGDSPGVQPLPEGQYQLLVRNSVRDSAGNPLGSNGTVPNGVVFTRNFSVIKSLGSESRVNTNPTGDQVFIPPDATVGYEFNPRSVASDANGDYVVAWSSDPLVTPAPARQGVWVKMYDAVRTPDGAAGAVTAAQTVTYHEKVVINPATLLPWLSNEILISNNPTATDAAVARDADGDFVVTWAEKNADPVRSWDVYARRFNVQGQPIGNKFVVNTTLKDVQRHPAVAMDTDGDYAITWQSQNQDGGGYGIYAQRFSLVGDRVGGTDQIQFLDFTSNQDVAFTLAWDHDNNPTTHDQVGTVVVHYTAGNIARTKTELETALKSAEFNLDASDFEVEVVSNSQISIRFIGQYGGRIVAPLTFRTLTPARSATLTVGAQGTTGEFLVNDTTANNQMYPSIGMDANGEFVISWTSYGQDGDGINDGNIYAKSFPANLVYQPTASQGSNSGTMDPRFTYTPLMTTLDDPAAHVVGSSAGFSGVVQVQIDGGYNAGGGYGSGSILVGGNYVLTAAHVVWDQGGNVPLLASRVEVTVSTPSGVRRIPASAIYVNPDYQGTARQGFTQGGDIAIIQLATPVTGVAGYEIYRGRDEVGRVANMYGYGATGTGDTGYLTPPDQLKRVGQNRFDADGTLLGSPNDYLVSDFDDRNPAHDTLGTLFGSVYADTGLGPTNEVCLAPGDSGGPSFLDGKIAGVTSWLGAGNASSDILPGTNASIGDVFAVSRVSSYAPWIDSIMRSSGKEFRVNENTFQRDAQGNLVYQTDPTTGNPILDANNQPIPILLADNESSNQKWSSVAMDAAGDYAITWTSYNHDGVGNGYGAGVNGTNGVFARRFDLGGSDGNVFQANTVAEGDQQHSSVAMDADGDFIITWESFQDRTDGSSTDVPDSFGIYAQRYARGSLVGTQPYLGTHGEMGSEFALNKVTDGAQRFPSAAMSDAGDTVIVWSGTGPGDTQGLGGIFQQQIKRPADDAGPRVTDAYNFVSATNVTQIRNGVSLGADVKTFVFDLSENMLSDTTTNWNHSIENPLNWVLSKDGVDNNSIISVVFTSAVTNADGKNKVVVTFDDFETTTGALSKGDYVLSIKDDVQDPFGTALDGDSDGTPGGYFTFNFSVLTGNSGLPLGITGPGSPAKGATDIVVNLQQRYTQDSPVVATDAAGDYVIAWVTHPTSSDADVVAQRYNRFGVPMGTVIPVNTYTAGLQVSPSVAMDPYGNFVVVWSGPGPEDDSGVYARRFDSLGNAQGTQFLVNQGWKKFVQDMASVTMDGIGDFAITWTSNGKDLKDNSSAVMVRAYNFRGQAVTGEVQVNTTVTRRQEASDVAMDAVGNFVVTWASDQQDGSSWGIYSRRFNAKGKALAGEVRVNANSKDKQTDAQIAMDSAGNYAITWSSYHVAANQFDIYERRFTNKGAALDKIDVRVNQTTFLSQITPDISMSRDGKYVVVWASASQDNAENEDMIHKDYGVYARMFTAKGAANPVLPREFRINAITVGDQVTPAVAMDKDGDFIVTWGGLDSSGAGIYERIVALNPASYQTLSGSKVASVSSAAPAPANVTSLTAALASLVASPSVAAASPLAATPAAASAAVSPQTTPVVAAASAKSSVSSTGSGSTSAALSAVGAVLTSSSVSATSAKVAWLVGPTPVATLSQKLLQSLGAAVDKVLQV